MSSLVIAEHDGQVVKPATLNAVTAAVQCGGEVHVLVAGQGCQAAAQAAAQVAGVTKVLLADAESLAHGLAENVAALVIALAQANGYAHVLFPATAGGKNVAPRVAALLDVAQVSDITRVVGPDTFERPIYAGNAIATVQSGDKVVVITVRTTGFDAAGSQGGSASVESVQATADSGASSFVGSEIARNDRPELTAAKIIVSGSPSYSPRWPTSWARRLAPAARRWTRATLPTTGRSGRRARSSLPSSTSPAASRGRSSTWRE